MNDRYHRAAKDGRLDLLKEAFKRDLNQSDDNGMTPTLWTAYQGNAEALALCCSRGGNAEKCDYTGNSALHLAAQNGHLNCLTFLVQLNANLWKLDNDNLTPLTVAGNRGHKKCVQYLDEVMNKKKSSDPKLVKKMEKEAKKEAEERRKKFAKLQKQQEQKMQELHNGPSRKISTTLNEVIIKQKRHSVATSSQTFSQATKSSAPKSLFATQRLHRHSVTTMKPSNEFVISADGRRQAETLRGVRSEQGSNVMFKSKEGMTPNPEPKSSPGKRGNVQDVFPEAESEETDDIPRFGPVLRWQNFNTASSMYSALPSSLPLDEETADSVLPSISKPVLKPAEDAGSSSSEEEEELDALASFLDSLDLSGYYRLFKEEKMDLDALAMCSAKDLKDVGLPFGDGMKIISAIKSRKQELDSELTEF